MKNSKKRCGMLVIKIDLEKAYDNVNWDFLVHMLYEFGFPHQFVTWIYTCISSTTYSLLINGQRYGLIDPRRGVRQGCPLSPYLFVFVTEYLSLRLLALHRQSLFQGVRLGQHAIRTIL